MTPSSHIVVHYHELWLKRGNRAFFLHKLAKLCAARWTASRSAAFPGPRTG